MAASPTALTVRLTMVVMGQAKLRAEKGLNLPDSVLALPVSNMRGGYPSLLPPLLDPPLARVPLPGLAV